MHFSCVVEPRIRSIEMTDTASLDTLEVSQTHINSYVSMIMVNLPFPPLPVVGLQGEDNDDAIVSGHDLLSRAIACQLIKPDVGKDIKDNAAYLAQGADVQARKTQLLSNMHMLIGSTWDRADISEKEKVERCYQIFCSNYRAYLGFYPSSPDVRIHAMDSVDKKSILCKQALKHLQSRTALNQIEEDEVVVHPSSFSRVLDASEYSLSYYQLMKEYCVDLHAALQYAQE